MWTYDATNIRKEPPPPTLDFWRFMIGDIVENDPIFQDEEIMVVAEMHGNNINQVMVALLSSAVMIVAQKTSGEWTNRRLGSQSESRDVSLRLKWLQKLLEEYEKKVSQMWLVGVRNRCKPIINVNIE